MGLPAIAMAALSVGQSVYGAASSNAASERQAAIQEEQYKLNRENAVTARNLKQAQSTLELRRNVEQIAGEKMDIALEALRKSESTKVAAAEAGVGGQTTELLISDPRTAMYRQNTKYEDQINDMATNAILQARGIDAEAINRINSVSRGISTKKSLFGAALEGGISAGINYASTKIK